MDVLPIVFQPLGPAEAETPVCAPPIETAPPGILRTGVLRRGVAIKYMILLYCCIANDFIEFRVHVAEFGKAFLRKTI